MPRPTGRGPASWCLPSDVARARRGAGALALRRGPAGALRERRPRAAYEPGVVVGHRGPRRARAAGGGGMTPPTWSRLPWRSLVGAVVLVAVVRQTGSGPFVAGVRALDATTLAWASRWPPSPPSPAPGGGTSSRGGWAWGSGCPRRWRPATAPSSSTRSCPAGSSATCTGASCTVGPSARPAAALRAVAWERTAGQVVHARPRGGGPARAPVTAAQPGPGGRRAGARPPPGGRAGGATAAGPASVPDRSAAGRRARRRPVRPPRAPAPGPAWWSPRAWRRPATWRRSSSPRVPSA